MSRASAPVRATVRRLALSRAPSLGARGVGLKLSHAVEHVGVPSLGSGAASLREVELETRAERAVQVMLDADDLARRVMQSVRDRTGWPVRDTELSLHVATSCGSTLREEGRLPTPDQEEALVSRLVDRVVAAHVRGRKLDADAFARQAGDRYASGWLAGGGANLTRWPPSQVGLGHDERPPLVKVRERRSGTWTQGTDRSVYSRYGLYYDVRAQSRVGSRHQHRCPQDERPRTDVLPLELSVDLACEPYGLEHEGHRQLLRTLAAHADGEPPVDPVDPGAPSRPRFVVWDEECRPAPAGDGEDQSWLVERLRSLLAHWWACGQGRDVRADWGDPAIYSHLVRTLLVRRVWQSLAGRERGHLDRAGTCMLDGLVKTALAKGVGTELPSVLRGERSLPDAPSTQRTNATVELILREVATTPDVPEPSPEDMIAAYADRHRGAGPAAEHTYLTVPELVALLAGAPRWEGDA